MKNQVVSRKVSEELNEKLSATEIEIKTVHNYYRALLYGWQGHVRWDSKDEWRFNWKKESFPGAGGIRWEKVPAPTLTEMLAILPEYIDKESVVDGKLQTVRYNRVNSSRVVEYVYYPNPALRLDGTFFGFNSIGADNCNEATACAKLMMWCIDGGHV